MRLLYRFGHLTTSNNGVLLKSVLGVTQCHWKWHYLSNHFLSVCHWNYSSILYRFPDKASYWSHVACTFVICYNKIQYSVKQRFFHTTYLHSTPPLERSRRNIAITYCRN